jgi:ElaB/YqjD/DUF883 family membrane-anchored ribosome-binding protein
MTMPYDSSASPGGSPGTELDTVTRSSGARTQIRDVKNQVVDQAKTSFRQARDSAASSLNDSRHQAADRMGGIASAVRSTSEHLRSENQGGMANLTDSLAEQVERLSSYLRERDLRAFRDDVENFARRQPAVAIGVALGLGMLGARFFKSSRRTGRFEGRRLPPGPAYASGQSDAGWYDREADRGDYGTGTGPAGGYGMSSQPAGGGYGES